MDSLKDILGAFGGDFVASWLFMLVFGLLSLYSFEALLNHIYLELEARKGFMDRKVHLERLFASYNNKVQHLMEEARRREEARLAREAED